MKGLSPTSNDIQYQEDYILFSIEKGYNKDNISSLKSSITVSCTAMDIIHLAVVFSTCFFVL